MKMHKRTSVVSMLVSGIVLMLASCSKSGGGHGGRTGIPDTLAPTTPTHLTATAISSSRINLLWTASTDNTGVTGYKIYRDGTLLTTSTTTSYPDTGLSPQTTYSYTVSAYDAANNESRQSATASATTPGQMGNIINASSASYSDVVSAVSSATYGDTVVVPSGAATWGNQLNITKYITIQGAGIGATVITGNIGNPKASIISYVPDATSRSENGLFRVTGFTFDGNNGDSRGVTISNKSLPVVDQIRIDHNRFYESSQAVYFIGHNYGLVDNNTFDSCRALYVRGNYYASWENEPLTIGKSSSIYFENNTMINVTLIAGGGSGGRYVVRYNTLVNPQEYWPMMDAHGNQQPVRKEYAPYGSRAMMVVEVYGNTITKVSSNGRLLDLRGGTALVFNNTITGGSYKIGMQLRDEDSSDRWYYAPSVVENNGVLYECISGHTSSVAGAVGNEPGVGNEAATYWKTPQTNIPAWKDHAYYSKSTKVVDVTGTLIYSARSSHTSEAATEPGVGGSWKTVWALVSWKWLPGQSYVYYPAYDQVKNTYLWNSTYNGTEINYNVSGEGGAKDSNWYIRPDREYWAYTPGFDGSSGVGVGSYVNMPTTCTTGVGYWATDKGGDWNKTNATSNDGALYKCTATNTWTQYYTPYTYPHPLSL